MGIKLIFQKKTNVLACIFLFYLSILPLLNIYNFSYIEKLRFGELIGIPLLFFICLIRKSPKIHILNTYYFVLVSYLFFVSLLLTFFIDSYSFLQTIVRIGRVSFYTIIILHFAKYYWNEVVIEKIYVVLSFICSIILIFQFVYLQVTGNYFSFVIPNLCLSTNFANSSEYYSFLQTEMLWYQKSYRPTSFFLEPAHFCEYVIFSVVMIIFSYKKDFFSKLCFFSIVSAIILSRSAIGFFLLLIILTYKFKNLIFSLKAYRRYIILFICLILFFVLLSGTDLFEKALWRVSTVSDSNSSTGNLRLIRGFVIFNEFPIVNKLFGIGFGNFDAFVEEYNILTFFDNSLDRRNEFMNSISVVLVSGGLVGICIFLLFLINCFKKASDKQRLYFIIFVVLLFCTNNFFKETYMLSLLFILLPQGSNNNISGRVLRR